MATWTDPHSDELLTYFSSADSGSEHRIERQSQFDASLIYNVLFSHRLVVPDVFFFASQLLRRHLEGGTVTFLHRALEHGLIVPAFRDGAVRSFSDAASSIYGMRGAYLDGIYDVADRLDRLTRDATERSRLQWPPALGERFANGLAELFGRDHLDTSDERVLRLWEETAQWRRVALDGGMALTKTAGGHGVRRIEMYTALGHHLKLIRADAFFSKPHELIMASQPELRERVSFLVDVINVSYQRNQAASFSSDTWSVLHNVPAPLENAAVAVVPDPIAWGTASLDSLELVIRVPTVDAILRADSADVFKVRSGDLGKSFEACRDDWVKHGGTEREARLREAADAYADALATVTKAAPAQGALRFDRRLVKGTLGPATGAAIASGGPAVAGGPQVVYSLVAAAAAAAISTFFLFRPEPRVRRQDEAVTVGRRPKAVERSLWASPPPRDG